MARMDVATLIDYLSQFDGDTGVAVTAAEADDGDVILEGVVDVEH